MSEKADAALELSAGLASMLRAIADYHDKAARISGLRDREYHVHRVLSCRLSADSLDAGRQVVATLRTELEKVRGERDQAKERATAEMKMRHNVEQYHGHLRSNPAAAAMHMDPPAVVSEVPEHTGTLWLEWTPVSGDYKGVPTRRAILGMKGEGACPVLLLLAKPGDGEGAELPDFDKIKAETMAHLDSPEGQAQLAESLDKARATTERLQEARKVTPEQLNKPFTPPKR